MGVGRSRTALVFASIGAALAVVLATGAASSPAATRSAPGWALHGPYSPVVRSGNFVATIDNPYFPLIPGTAFHYQGRSGETPQTDDMVVTHRAQEVLGVTCTVVRDTVSEHGQPLERTFDWYAQDKHGNVWYMGEDSLELRNGHFVRASDSWEGGVNAGKPGIIMPATAEPGDVYRQEYYPPGGALDQARVLGRDELSQCRTARSRVHSSRSSGAPWSRSWRRSTTSQASARCRSTSCREDTSASTWSG